MQITACRVILSGADGEATPDKAPHVYLHYKAFAQAEKERNGQSIVYFCHFVKYLRPEAPKETTGRIRKHTLTAREFSAIMIC